MKESNIPINNITSYQIKSSDDSYFNWDEFVDKVELVQLEMTNQSAIGWFTDCFIDENDIFVFDDRYDHLFHFDAFGKFIKEIGQRGMGPGEFLEMRDFCIVDDYVYILDFKKIHCYDRNTGKHIESWSFKNENGFNPSKIVIFDRDNYFLWATCPDVLDKDKIEFYHMQEIKKGKTKAMYFKYEYQLLANPLFFPCGKYSYNIRPIDGEDIVYRLTKDTIFAVCAIDFGDKALSKKKVNELKEAKEPNAYLKSNAFKSISNVLETKDYLYFRCTGPEAKGYEGLINKQTGESKIGRWNPRESPFFLFSDGIFLYGYYDPSFLVDKKEGEKTISKCFDIVNNLNVSIDDNCIIAKISLK